MKPVLYPSNETDFVSMGLGSLSDVISCVVQEQINGIYELTMVYPTTGVHYDELETFRILYVTHDDSGEREPFEIYKISRPMNGRVTVNAWHISYRLRRMTCRPFSADNLPSALGQLETNSMTVNPFTFTTIRTTVANIHIDVPMAMRSVMGGVKGSILDVYGGEWRYRHYECILENRLGQDTGFQITYGKNLISAKKVSDSSNTWTGVVPYWQDQDGNSTYYNGVINSSYAETVPVPLVIPVDATQDFETEPSDDQLLAWGESYVQRNEQPPIPESFDVDFVALWQTEEYRETAFAERLSLGDTVSVKHDELNIDASARIVGYKYDVLAERFTTMTIGKVSSNIAQTIRTSIEDATEMLSPKTWVNARLSESTNLITGGLGGYVVMNLDTDGHPQEIIVMDSPDKATAVNCIRINQNGIGFSQNGYTGPFNSAWTIDGHFDATFITAGILNADLMRAGTIMSADGTTYWDLENNIFYLAAQGGTIQGSDIETENTTQGVRSDVADILQHFVINDDASLQIITSNGMSITLSQGTVTVMDNANNTTVITGQEVTANILTATENIFIGNHKLLARSNGTNTTLVYVGD